VAEEQPQLLLGEINVYQAQGDGVRGQVPDSVPGVLPLKSFDDGQLAAPRHARLPVMTKGGQPGGRHRLNASVSRLRGPGRGVPNGAWARSPVVNFLRLPAPAFTLADAAFTVARSRALIV
jgi:hypothetical protein